ncbi:hypothetical protein QQF64_023689 [Cirrhinus molitorella]|uniref:NADH dehydrogenase [ubiquinone] 1 beta subcomplex subunit 1 n=1 Tax=Cirrhinus molitorella TaxID=172907 RepID=A0ABR3NJ50_9TELE
MKHQPFLRCRPSLDSTTDSSRTGAYQRKLAEGIMVNFAAAIRTHWVNILVPLGFVIGVYLDRWNDQKLTAFRNKSALYSRYIN